MTRTKRRAGSFLSGLVLTLFTFVSYATVQPPQVCVPPPSGLISWWPGDDNANDIANDNHGTLQDGVTFAIGFVGQAFSFDGTSGYVEVQNSADLSLTNTLTIEAWFKTTSASGQAILYKHGASGDRSYGLQIVNQNADFFVVSGGITRNHFGTAIVTDGEWHHIIGVFDGSTSRHELYIDGVLENNIAPSYNSIDTSTVPIWIGAGAGTTSSAPNVAFFNGSIDEIAIFDRALTASEIQTQFNAGSAGKCKSQDTDGDGIPDAEDNCPNSIVSPTVVIGGCDSGVANTVFPNGCTISDRIQQCAAGAQNHGQFVSCVAHLTNEWKKAGIISGQQKGAIQSCAAQANLPQ